MDIDPDLLDQEYFVFFGFEHLRSSNNSTSSEVGRSKTYFDPRHYNLWAHLGNGLFVQVENH